MLKYTSNTKTFAQFHKKDIGDNISRSSSQVFFRMNVLKYFAKFAGKLPLHVFSCQFDEIFQGSFFTKHFRTATSLTNNGQKFILNEHGKRQNNRCAQIYLQRHKKNVSDIVQVVSSNDPLTTVTTNVQKPVSVFAV